MSPPPTDVLVLGIDAASPELLERWAREGALPTLRRLLGRAAVARTRGIEGFFVGSTWPSLSTGVGPARHGIHYLAQLRPGTYDYERIAERPERCAPFWVTASRAGRRVGILDVPLSRPADDLNGIQTVEWGGHDSLYGFRARPEELAREIERDVGLHPQSGSCDAPRRTARDYAAFVDRLVRGAEAKGRLTRALLARGGWDLFVQVFTEAHCVGHQCWHLHDVSHPNHDPELAGAVGDPLLRVYRAIDAAIGVILADAGDAIVLLVVAHGMRHQYGAQLLLPELLARLGVAAPAVAQARAPGVGAALRAVGRGLPPGVRARLRPVVRRLRPDGAGDGLPRLPVDPERSLCFPVSNGLPVGAIRLNLAGREPAGRLAVAEAERFCERLAADFAALRRPDTGERLVRRVVRTSDLHAGGRLDELPDLLVEWSDQGPLATSETGPAEAAVVRAASDRVGVVEAVNDWGRTGEHRPGGLVAGLGPRIAPARLDEVDLLDLAPTILGILGIEPRGLDGTPIPALIGE